MQRFKIRAVGIGLLQHLKPRARHFTVFARERQLDLRAAQSCQFAEMQSVLCEQRPEQFLSFIQSASARLMCGHVGAPKEIVVAGESAGSVVRSPLRALASYNSVLRVESR